MPKSHKDQAHEDHEGASQQRRHMSQQAHADAEAALLEATRAGVEAAKAANPFRARNILITIASLLAVAAICSMAGIVWNGVASVKAALQEIHESMLVQGIMMTNMQNDLTMLKNNCVTKDSINGMIDDRVHTMRRGAELMTHPSSAVPNELPPMAGAPQPKGGFGYYQ